MVARRAQDSDLRGYPGALGGQDRRLNAETLIGRQTILQPEPDTWRVAVFDYAKDTHFRREGIRCRGADGRRFERACGSLRSERNLTDFSSSVSKIVSSSVAPAFRTAFSRSICAFHNQTTHMIKTFTLCF